MRNLSTLWFIVLEQFLKGETKFICNCMNRLQRENKISRVELRRLAEDLYSQPQECYGEIATDTMREGKYGALWHKDAAPKTRIHFLENRIGELQREETANLESYM